MNDSRFTVDHVRLATDKPFGDVTTAFERQLGRFDPDVYKSLAARGDTEAARAKIETMAGPSGFMLFATHNHGALLRLAGQKHKAVQYVVGNPLFALQMTQHDIRAGLYTPRCECWSTKTSREEPAWSTTSHLRCSASSTTPGSPRSPACWTGSWRTW